MSDKTITIEVDGRQLEARPGQMLIEVTDQAGIHIPRFCYHKHLSVAANCRMCLVEVENAPKPLPACATPVSEGMKVRTRSSLARAAQKGTMEFLLINHPLDCPICDQGGECELQDVSLTYGSDLSRFSESKRAVLSQNIGPLIATEMTRCIHCTRCVRFGEEIAGLRELGAIGRGEHTEIGPYIEQALHSELSGNVIDLCPVGALTAKPSRFKARPWEMNQYPSISIHDGMGSALFIHTRNQRIIRTVPRENESINQTWIADRDRFSYQGIDHADRIHQPWLRVDGQLKPVDWSTALNQAAEWLKQSDQIGAIIHPSSSLEEMFLAQKLMRSLGSDHIDYRLKRTDFSQPDPQCAWLGCHYHQLAENELNFLIGSWLRKEIPMLNHRLRQSVLKGGRVIALNPVDYAFNYHLAACSIVPPSRMVTQLAAVARALGADDWDLADSIDEQARTLAEHIQSAANGSILLGASAYTHPQYSLLRALAHSIAQKTGLKIGELGEGANQRAADQLGLSRQGWHTSQMIDNGLDTCLLLGVESQDLLRAHAFNRMIDQARCIALSTHFSPELKQSADLILPIACFAETAGTYINLQGDQQSIQGAVPPPGQARPAWKVLCALGHLIDAADFDYQDAEQVKQAALAVIKNELNNDLPPFNSKKTVHAVQSGIERIIDWPIYSSDALTRRSSALQQTPDAWQGVRISPDIAAKIQLQDGDAIQLQQGQKTWSSTAYIDARLPQNTLWLPIAQGDPFEHHIEGFNVEKA